MFGKEILEDSPEDKPNLLTVNSARKREEMNGKSLFKEKQNRPHSQFSRQNTNVYKEKAAQKKQLEDEEKKQLEEQAIQKKMQVVLQKKEKLVRKLKPKDSKFEPLYNYTNEMIQKYKSSSKFMTGSLEDAQLSGQIEDAKLIKQSKAQLSND